jgi:hypothetical protein
MEVSNTFQNKPNISGSSQSNNAITNTSTQDCEEHRYTPVTVFIIICSIYFLWIIIHNSLLSRFPTIFSLCVVFIQMTVCTALLIVTGYVSVDAEWVIMIFAVALMMFNAFILLNPDVLFYPELS